MSIVAAKRSSTPPTLAEVTRLIDSLPDSALLTIVQVSTYSQEKMSVWYRRVHKGLVRVVRIGGSVRIRKRDLFSFFDYQ